MYLCDLRAVVYGIRLENGKLPLLRVLIKPISRIYRSPTRNRPQADILFCPGTGLASAISPAAARRLYPPPFLPHSLIQT